MTAASAKLTRRVGVVGATLMGLGSILGTGVFVTIGIAAGAAGPAVLLAIFVAGLVATCNALSSAQLAALHPVSGGTYEYGYRWLTPSLGFAAGWMFLCAKSASAATAALGFAGYIRSSFQIEESTSSVPIAVAAVVVLTLLVNCGIHRSSQVNIAIVSVTVGSLLVFLAWALPAVPETGYENMFPFFDPRGRRGGMGGLLEASALMFVAFTGYGRIATLGEEVMDPRNNIPRAIIATLVVSMILYAAVGLALVGVLGAAPLAAATEQSGAPLAKAATALGSPLLRHVVSIGAVTAMLGVLLNLIIGLSRVVLAMGRRQDLPAVLSTLDRSHRTPYLAVILVGTLVGLIACVGSVRVAWSFSAFTVLIYYAITNLAALRLGTGERLYWPLFAWVGLVACVLLAFWVDVSVWVAGVGVLLLGFLWRWAWFGMRRWRESRLAMRSRKKATSDHVARLP